MNKSHRLIVVVNRLKVEVYMQLVKRNINVYSSVLTKTTGITLDDHINVPDINGDINLLYRTSDEPYGLNSLDVNIDFEEVINIDNVLPSYKINADLYLDELDIAVINSRKIGIRDIVKATVNGYEENDVEEAKAVENGDGVECQYRHIRSTELTVSKRDILRLKETVAMVRVKL